MSSIEQASENALGLKAATQEPRVYLRRWAGFGLAGSRSYIQFEKSCHQSSHSVLLGSRRRRRRRNQKKKTMGDMTQIQDTSQGLALIGNELRRWSRLSALAESKLQQLTAFRF